MFRNYLKTAWRNLLRNKQATVINVAGLTLGIAVFLLIIAFVSSEWNANTFHKNYDLLYRANILKQDGTAEDYLAPGFAPLLQQKVPGINKCVRVAEGIGSGVVSTPELNANSFREEKMLYVDGSFLDVFTFPLIEGNASLSEPSTMAISEAQRTRLFGNNKALGKTVLVSNQFGNKPYRITAVYKNMPANSDIQANVLLSLHTLETAANRDENDWADPNTLESAYCNIYVLLKQNVTDVSVAKQATSAAKSATKDVGNDQIVLQPFSNLHLAPSFDYPFVTYGSVKLVRAFLAVAVLILLIAFVNYINLSTAQAIQRSKDVGVRKVLGASRAQLIFQYLSETLMLTFISVAVAFIAALLLLPSFNNLTGKDFSFDVFTRGWAPLISCLLIVIAAALSGVYIAFIVSAYKPIIVLRGATQPSSPASVLRKSLVVFQFGVSIVFIIATIVLYHQLRFMNTSNLGMNLNQLVVISGPTVSGENQAAKNAAFKQQLSELPFVKKYCASNNVPGIGYNFSTQKITGPQHTPADEEKSYSMFICDEHFFDTYGIKFMEGKTFSKLEAEASWNNIPKVILNQRAALSLGFGEKDTVTGKSINWAGKMYEVGGVINDYHHLSLRDPIRPTIYLASVSYGYFTIEANAAGMSENIARLEKLYRSAFPGNPFEYFFSDELYAKQYANEQKLGTVFISAAGVAIFIACLGLFGLTAYSARQRVKEIGIRKVLGASAKDITALLSKDFLYPVILAFLVASPLAWWIMHTWLQSFAYRVNISWWVFGVAAAATAIIALATVSIQSVKAAMANPVKNLRSE